MIESSQMKEKIQNGQQVGQDQDVKCKISIGTITQKMGDEKKEDK